MTGSEATDTFAGLSRSSTALLTTFRTTGEGVPTPVSIALVDRLVYFTTSDRSGKARRLARSDRVDLAPSTVGGVPLGDTVQGRARALDGADRRHARRLLRPTRALFWSYWTYRIRGNSMIIYEVRPDPVAQPDLH